MKRKPHFQRTLHRRQVLKCGRKAMREQCFDKMNEVVPWTRLLSLEEPHYPKAGNGSPLVGLAIRLRAYFVQQLFNLSDAGMKDALYDSASLRHFVGVDLGTAAAPYETTIHRLEGHDLAGRRWMKSITWPRARHARRQIDPASFGILSFMQSLRGFR